MKGACRCGHDGDAHDHYRRGTDCALCDCPGWRRAWLWWLRRAPGKEYARNGV